MTRWFNPAAHLRRATLHSTILHAGFTFFALAVSASALAQERPPESTPTVLPSVTGAPTGGTLDHRVYELERRAALADADRRHFEGLVRSTSDGNRFFFYLLSGVIGLIVTIQSIFHAVNPGAKAVADVLNVVKDTMETRLTQEKEALERADKAKKEVDDIRGELTRVVGHFEGLAHSGYKRIESLALQLAKTPRHEFKEMPDRLFVFCQQYDEYVADLQPLAPDGLVFTARVPYIRGIVAHYLSQPDQVKAYLAGVISRTDREPNETEVEHARRVANAYYYLGVNESNFGNYVDAIRLFEHAISLDPNERDLLSRIVLAECYIFSGRFGQAVHYIETEIDRKIQNMKDKGEFRSFHIPLQVRSDLLKVNLAIVKNDPDWSQMACDLLEPFCRSDCDSYAALSSLGQAYYVRKDPRASDLFDQAYECIIRRRHLETTTEVRSRILLLMVAAVCSQMGTPRVKKRHPSELLDEAKTLLDRLPRRDTEDSTVFSPITKRNETRTTLAGHIAQIELGVVAPATRIDVVT